MLQLHMIHITNLYRLIYIMTQCSLDHSGYLLLITSPHSQLCIPLIYPFPQKWLTSPYAAISETLIIALLTYELTHFVKCTNMREGGKVILNLEISPKFPQL